jgi:hypothetical protein
MFSKKFLVLVCVSVVALTADNVHAGLIAYEGFAYNTGSLDGANGGTGWSNAWSASSSGSASVSATGLTYASGGQILVTSGGSASLPGTHYGDFRAPASTPASGTMYISFMADRTGTGESGYLGLSLFNDSTEHLYIGAQSNGGQYWYMQQNSSNEWGNTTETAGATPTLLVARIDFGTSSNVYKLYVNPSLTSEPGTASASFTSSAAFSWDRIRIQSGVAGDIDEIRMGTTYADVVSSVPEPTTCILLGTGAMAILAYAWRKRK